MLFTFQIVSETEMPTWLFPPPLIRSEVNQCLTCSFCLRGFWQISFTERPTANVSPEFVSSDIPAEHRMIKSSRRLTSAKKNPERFREQNFLRRIFKLTCITDSKNASGSCFTLFKWHLHPSENERNQFYSVTKTEVTFSNRKLWFSD